MNPWLSTLVISITLATLGCGSNNNELSQPETSPEDPAIAANASHDQNSEKLSANLIGVQGIEVRSNKLRSITDNEGGFTYYQGHDIKLYVGDILVGSAKSTDNHRAIYSIEDFITSNAHQDTASNIIRFLVTLDYDLSPANGVMISANTLSAAEGISLNFDQSTELFVIDAEKLLQTELAPPQSEALFIHSLAKLRSVFERQSDVKQRAFVSAFQYPKADEEVLQTSVVNAEFPDIVSEASAVIDLMLSNTIKDGNSPLEQIFEATNTELVLHPRSAEEGSLIDIYIEYKHHVPTIGQNAPHIIREDVTTKPLVESHYSNVHHLAIMTDFQVRDDESPMQLNMFKFLVPSAFYPSHPHVLYLVDDMISTMRAFEKEQVRPIDMAIFTGDLLDIGQYNETRWGIDVLDGGMIDPDSGEDDDPVAGFFHNNRPNDSFDPFIATGLNGKERIEANIPWYYVPGNHDGAMLGNFPISDRPLHLFGKKIRNGTRGFYDAIATGDKNWLGYNPSLSGFLQHLIDPENFYIVPDDNRRLLRSNEIATEMFNTTSEPIGHGMQIVLDNQGELKDSELYYSLNSSDGIIRHIILDSNMLIGPQGLLDLADINWLNKELKAAQETGQLVIVSSHHKPQDIIINGDLLVSTLNQYPNVIALLVAHTHTNNIRPRLGSDDEHGYWEIETASMVNWPQQFRMLEIHIDKVSATGFIKSTMLNHHSESPLDVGQRGRFLAYLERRLEAHIQLKDDAITKAEGYPEDRNALLYFKIPESVLTHIP